MVCLLSTLLWLKNGFAYDVNGVIVVLAIRRF